MKELSCSRRHASIGVSGVGVGDVAAVLFDILSLQDRKCKDRLTVRSFCLVGSFTLLCFRRCRTSGIVGRTVDSDNSCG